jgi:biopolymer transport protein ExbD
MVASPTFKGIPYDSTDNQFDVWLYEARKTNPNMRIAIKADQETPYPVIAEVIKTLKKRKAHKFNLITSQEADPRITGKKPE